MGAAAIAKDDRPRPLRGLSGPVTLFCVGSAVVLSCFSALECHLFVSRFAAGIPLLPSVLYGCSVWLWMAPLLFALLLGVERSPWFRHVSVGSVGLQILLATAAACVHLELIALSVHWLVRRWPVLWDAGYNALPIRSWQRALPEVLLYLLIWAASLALVERRSAEERKLEGLALRQSLTEAELSALQRQMQPHFLLNTLNTITGLLEAGEHRSALRIVERLSVLTKQSLTRDLPALVAVEEELRTAEAYLAIEQVRFGDRLEVEISIDPRVLTQKMPPFLLQPLVENAVKHSVHHNLESSRVRVSLTRQGEHVSVRITDNGAGFGSAGVPGTGISLENIESRLHLLYRDGYRMALRTAEGGGCEVDVCFPGGT